MLPCAPFLRRLLVFLLPIAVAGIGLECVLRSSPNSYRATANIIRERADSVEVMILGNSHAFYGLQTNLLSPVAVNMAHVSQTLTIDREMLEHYAPQCPRLKNVILICDHSNLFDPPLDSGEESFRITYYHIYMGLCRPVWPKYFDWELWHTTAAMEKLKSIAGHSSFEAPLVEEKGDSIARRRADKHTCRDWSLAEANAAEIRKIATYCQTHHLHLILLATPVTTDYLRHIPARQKAYLHELMSTMEHTYGVTIRDYGADVRFCSDDFIDTDHLTPSGAARFTEILNMELLD